MSLLLNMLSRLVITFLPRSKHLLISWLQSPCWLEPKKMKCATVSTFYPSTCHEVIGPDVMILVFWMLSFKPTFSLSFFTFIKRLFSSSSLSAISESEVAQSCLTLCDQMDSRLHQAPLSMGFSRQQYWSRLPFPPSGDLLNPGIEPGSPTLQADAFRLSHQGSSL